jgi:hypothetical protein
MKENLDWSDRHWLASLVKEANAPGPELHKNDSVDAVIDHQIMQAEKSGVDRGKNVSEGRRKKKKIPTLRESLMVEAEDDAEAEKAAPAAPEPPQKSQSLDREAFCSEVARIYQNANGLIDLPGTVLRRTLNYVIKNYGEEKAKEIEDTLESNFGISLRRPEDRDAENQIPNAKGAGPELGG